MGIRINTVLGYGFRYCRGARDPRFNPWVFETSGVEHPTLGSLWEIDDLRPLIAKHLRKRLKNLGPRKEGVYSVEHSDLEMEIMRVTEKGSFKPHPSSGRTPGEPIRLSDILKVSGYADECSDGRYPIVFTDPCAPHWVRHDDIIDYYAGPDEEDGGIKDSVKMLVGTANLARPIYPWDSVVNRKTGKRPPGGSSLINRHCYVEHWLGRGGMDKRVLKEGGVKTPLEYQRDLVPYIPIVIRETCDLLGIFRNPLTTYRLKPMLYRYWC